MKKNIKINVKLLFLTILMIFCKNILAQNKVEEIQTTIEGVVVDSIAGDSIPFANISVVGTTQGVSTDENGRFSISLRSPNAQLKITYVGYQDKIQAVRLGEKQTLVIKIASANRQLNEVVVRVEKYRNRNNPAVDLVRKVIDKKEQNQLSKYEYYQYHKYERLELDLANVSEALQDRKITKNINFFFADTDTTSVKGKSLLPAYLGENAYEVYHRKSPNTTKEIHLGNKHSNIGSLFDDKGMNQYLNHLYIEANIYDNEILVFKKPFLGPLSPIAPTFYRYYIIDTVIVEGKRCVNLGFFPRSKTDLTLEGNLYITDDSLYALRKVTFGVPKNVNVNYINAFKVTQNFDPMPDGTWIKTRDQITLDFGVGSSQNGKSIYGKRNIQYSSFVFNQPIENNVFLGIGTTTKLNDFKEKDSIFWKKNRTIGLSSKENNIYQKADSLIQVPDFKLFMKWKHFWITGYWQTKNVEFGPVASFYSFNDLEGGRIRISGRTLHDWNNRLRFEGYGAYGLRDKKWKYNAALTYQLNKEPFGNCPQNAFKIWSYDDVEVPGQNLENRAADNWLLSFRRGKFDKMYYKQAYGLSYTNEQMNGLYFNTGLQYRRLTPAGSLTFTRNITDSNSTINVNNISTNEGFLRLRYAPNQEYFQGATYRSRIYNKYPIFEAKITAGTSTDAAGVKNNYQEVNLSVFKRFFIAPIGHTDFMMQGGRVFGKNISYPMLQTFAANQTLFYEQFSYNQMNYLEFISDKFISVNIEHSFDGFFFNKIPLINKLKLREFVTFKGVYGGLDAANDPNKNNTVYAFPTDNATGRSLTSNFKKAPYMEASIGIGNIAKSVRVDFIRRLSYLDNPDVVKWRIAASRDFGF